MSVSTMRVPSGLLKPRTHTGSALRAAAAKGGATAHITADRQPARLTASCLGRGGNTEQFVNLEVSTSRTVGRIAGAANQGLEDMVTGLAAVFIEWHTWNDSSVSGNQRADTTRAGVVGACRAMPYSRS